jgi:hypothetical protein
MFFQGETLSDLNKALIATRKAKTLPNRTELKPKEEWGDCENDLKLLIIYIRDLVETKPFQTNPDNPEEAQESKRRKIHRGVLRHIFRMCRQTRRIVSPNFLKEGKLLFAGIENPNSPKNVFAKIIAGELVIGFETAEKTDSKIKNYLKI